MKKLFLIIGLFAGIAAYAADNNAAETNNTTKEAEVNTEIINPSLFGENEQETFYETGLSSITETGISFIYNQRFFNIYQALGKRVNPYVFIGGGIGVQVGKARAYQFQLLTDLRVNLLNKRVTPIFITQIGLNKVGPETLYTKEQRHLENTQMNFNAGTGILVKALPNASFTLNGGYSLFTDFNKDVHGAFVKIGYIF